ncbi:MAG TPA: ATP-binding protein [Burkholderiales bacterium]|nr:ATP-binding protein [Burkholderiales bacterium]
MSDDFIDITPDVHFLESIRADRGSWASLVAEGVDNSLDADATQIAIQLLTHSVVIADDGRGIERNRESAIVRLGEHRPMPGTKLGRFGMGIKYNATSAGDQLDVESTSSDGHLLLNVDWTKVIRSGRWHIPKPKWSPTLVSRGTGTTIKIGRLRWDAPKEKDIALVRDHLAQIFYPAIEHGATIRVNGSVVRLLREPQLTEIVEHTIQFPNGKGAQVRGGLLVDPEKSPLYGVQVSYKHRVIIPKGVFGCDSYSGLRRMFARVTLTADWGLTRFKDNLNDPDAAQLEDAVQEVLKPILEKCHSAQMELKVEEMTERLNELLPTEIRATRPPRQRPKTNQQHKRKESRQGESERDESPTGPARSPRTPINTLTIAFDGPLCDEHGYGMFTKGRPNRITLATDNPDIAALLEQRDTQLAVRCLLGFALMIYQHARETDPGQKQLPFDESSFGMRVWRSAARQNINTSATSVKE